MPHVGRCSTGARYLSHQRVPAGADSRELPPGIPAVGIQSRGRGIFSAGFLFHTNITPSQRADNLDSGNSPEASASSQNQYDASSLPVLW